MTITTIVFDAYGTLYDVQSVAAVTDQAFPGYGDIITQIWRIKQLEYTWLRSLMHRYEDFSIITRHSLIYTLKILGLSYEDTLFERIMDKYVHLDLYPDARQALEALKGRKLAILSNGSPAMLTALVRNTGLDKVLDATISVNSKKTFKPNPEAYTLIEIKARREAQRSLVRLLESMGCDRREIRGPECGVDRTCHPRSDGVGLRKERSGRAAHNVQGHPDADGRARA